MSDQQSTSRGIPEKGVNLEKAQDAFEWENRTEQFVSKIVVRRSDVIGIQSTIKIQLEGQR